MLPRKVKQNVTIAEVISDSQQVSSTSYNSQMSEFNQTTKIGDENCHVSNDIAMSVQIRNLHCSENQSISKGETPELGHVIS